ncbi:MAG: peptidase [Bacteroidetes bacterium]|nr:peptidase [Bacteroidota bacterium]
MKRILSLSAYVMISFLIFSCSKPKEGNKEVKDEIAKFAKTAVKYDDTLLDDNQKIVVQKLYEAAKIMDDIFLGQVYSGNTELKESLKTGDKDTYELFNIMFGPFNRLDHDKPFVGDKAKPDGANFYPEDMTKEEFENWIAVHPEDEAAFTSEFTVIKRDGEKLIAVPYSVQYSENLKKAANLMREAANYADNPSLKEYLIKRAAAFETNDYYESDMAWMDLKDHTIEIVIGPYEVYEDALFNFKAAFECFLTIVDPVESKKLDIFVNYLNDMEHNLPYPAEHKNFARGSESPMVVVQLVYSAGDTKAGVQTLAFNLPNDERVRKAKGSKKVMLKNIHEAKFETILTPIAEKIMEPEQLKYVTFEGFFNHTLMHEISHGLGPGFITVDGRKTEVKKELKETYSTIEECKADVLGLFNNQFMIEKGVFPAEFENEMWCTFLAGAFRSMRFGIGEAHGGSNAIIYNYLLDNGAFEYNESTQKVKVNFDKAYTVLTDLANKLLMIQATGDYNASKELIAKYVVETPSIKILRDKLTHLPVDIKPEFQIEK